MSRPDAYDPIPGAPINPVLDSMTKATDIVTGCEVRPIMVADGYDIYGHARPKRQVVIIGYSGPGNWPRIRYIDTGEEMTVAPDCLSVEDDCR